MFWAFLSSEVYSLTFFTDNRVNAGSGDGMKGIRIGGWQGWSKGQQMKEMSYSSESWRASFAYLKARSASCWSYLNSSNR